ncbi:hypothetical protein [Prevotella falsenii]|uniref:hypothetical protein n=1 Tax=Prevotella falsenii TaxID=515414 RepID=UPI0004696CCA|nr:hypothetical protein [Prevotella falsenii]
MKVKSIISKSIMALLAVFALTACGDNVDYEYSNYHCNLTIDNAVHLDATLASAMNALSPGVFTTIKPLYKDGTNYFYFKNNQGMESEKRFNAIDDKLQSHLRIGMNGGLIVGFGNLDTPARFFAYDLQCPNCFDLNAPPLRSYELTVSGTGIAACKTCKRTYNLNTGGNIVSGEKGKTMTRYRASTAGPNGLLRVY